MRVFTLNMAWLLSCVLSFSVVAIGNSNAVSTATNTVNDTKFNNEQVIFTLPAGWLLGEVVGIEKRSNGNFVVFNRGQHQLLEFDAKHNFVREIGAGLFKNPHGLRKDKSGNIWTTDASTHLVLRFDSAGQVTMVLGKNGTAGTGWFDRDYNLVLFNQPLDVAFDHLNNIYVVDKGNARIVKLDANGNLIKMWGKEGTMAGEFKFPHSIIVDDHNRIYVADRENKRVQRFDLNGKFIDEWKNVGYPYVLFKAKGSVWMTDARSEQVRQFSFDGELINHYQGEVGRNPGQFSAVHGIHVDINGVVHVTQVFNWGGVNRLTKQGR